MAEVDVIKLRERCTKTDEVPKRVIQKFFLTSWTRDIEKAHVAARKLKAGTVWINTFHAFDVGSPWGWV